MTKTKLRDLVRKRGFIVLDSSLTAKQALIEWKKAARPAKISHNVYVIDQEKRLVGLVELRELLLEQKGKTLEQMMNTNFTSIQEKQSVSNALSISVEQEKIEMPVIDANKKLVGIISTERLVDTLSWRDSKNVHHLVDNLKSLEDFEINLKSVWKSVKGRIIWLLSSVLVGVFIAGGIIKHFEAAIIIVPAVTFFIPVLMGFGGNIGAQTTTLFVRLSALDDSKAKRKLWKMLWAEILTGLVLGVLMGAVAAVSSNLLFADTNLSMVLFVSMVLISLFSIIIGLFIPYACNKLGLDSALVSMPVSSTIKDVFALLIYFGVIGLLL
ncbi:MAG: magnesium transporter [Candidatus Altiarchaeota archaeon]|nr:magnesium transporter [Candidatus Altiarchaeota archaeon]